MQFDVEVSPHANFMGQTVLVHIRLQMYAVMDMDRSHACNPTMH